MTRIILDLEHDDERALIRLLRALLKQLGRVHGIRCHSVRPEGESK